LNEGSGLGRPVGSLLLSAGGLSVFIGVIMVSALKANRPPDENASNNWLRLHKRLW
jgi:hypothetical protein